VEVIGKGVQEAVGGVRVGVFGLDPPDSLDFLEDLVLVIVREGQRVDVHRPP
jgi:hypothetical protein